MITRTEHGELVQALIYLQLYFYEIPFLFSISRLIQQRQIRAYLWPDFIYNMTQDGSNHKKAVEVLHDFTLKVRC